MKPWIIYTRVSTDEQAREGASLDMQADHCRNMAKACGNDVLEVISDAGISGKSMDRAGVQKVLDLIKADKIGGVLIWKLDRITRSLKDLIGLIELLEAHKVALVSLHDKIDTAGPMGRFTLHLLGALAQLEREQISLRVSSTMQHLKGQGYYVGRILLPGFVTETRTGERHKRLAVDPKLLPVMQQLFQRAAGGANLRALKGFLADHNIIRKDITAVARILRHHAYVEHGVVDEVTFAEAGRSLESRSPESRRRPGVVSHKTERVWLLRGIGRCGCCGGALVGSTGQGRSGKRYPYYRCANESGGEACSSKPLPAESWERVVIEAVVKAVQAGKVLDAWKRHAARLAASVGPLSQRREAIVAERTSLQTGLDTLMSMAVEAGKGSPASRAAFARIGRMQEQIDLLDREQAGIDGQLAASDIATMNAEAAGRLLAKGIDQLPTLPVVEQVEIMQGVVRCVAIHAGTEPRLDIDLIEPGGGDGGGDDGRGGRGKGPSGPTVAPDAPAGSIVSSGFASNSNLVRGGGLEPP